MGIPQNCCIRYALYLPHITQHGLYRHFESKAIDARM